MAQHPQPWLNVHIRTRDPRAVTSAIRQEVDDLRPDLFVTVEPMTAAISVAILPAQLGAGITAACGGLAALLAMMGIYALVALTVTERTREIGIRKAIGARTVDVLRVVVAGSVGPVLAGFLLGAGFGALGALALRGFVIGVSPLDPLTLAATGLSLVFTAAAAAALPAWRASQVDPLRTLRGQ
jgi:hypothetical protein